ncbi:unnamed protein product, partial [Vitis vinifera]|uniref:Uncharacterized protein n=1 Tax=Vitis vinifera TaxID=29760 RepID=D7U8F9_VITVI
MSNIENYRIIRKNTYDIINIYFKMGSMYTNSFGTSYKCNIHSPHKNLLSICISNQPFFYYKYIVLNKIFLKKKALPQVASSLQP